MDAGITSRNEEARPRRRLVLAERAPSLRRLCRRVATWNTRRVDSGFSVEGPAPA